MGIRDVEKTADYEMYQLLKQDPETGIHQLLRRYGGAIKTICKNFLYDCSDEDVEEAIADTIIRFWKGLHNYNPSAETSLKAYLFAVARNAARDKRRQLKKGSIFSLEEVTIELVSSENIESDYLQREQEMILHQCIEEMDEPDRSVFLYRYFYGFDHRKIADMLSLVPKKVENILYRGKQKLQKMLVERGMTYDK